MSRPNKRPRRESADPLSFARQLRERAESGNKRKGERTRDRLTAAAARQLETVGYRDLRVTDINEEAGVSNALFYVYFKNKQEITHEVLEGFLKLLGTQQSPERPPSTSLAERLYRGNLDYCRCFIANPGLMRCLIQFGDEIPEFGRLWSDWNDRWIQRAMNALAKDEPALNSTEELRLAISGLGLMVDGLLRQIFVEGHGVLRSSADSLGRNPEALALFLTRLWYRALYCRELDDFPIEPQAPAPPLKRGRGKA